MFEDLHALAQSATLLIAVSAEGDALRVSVTPTQAGNKPHALRPLSLLGTPAELDSDFGAALIAWQAPRRSLVEQAEAAAGAADDEDDVTDTKKASGAKPATAKGKPGPKKKDAAPALKPAPAEADGKKPAADETKADPEPEFQLDAPVAPPPADGEAEAAEEAPPVAVAPVVDDKTLDLF